MICPHCVLAWTLAALGALPILRHYLRKHKH